MRKQFAIGVLLVLAGCVFVGSNFDMAAVDRLSVGMSKEQVIKALGRPTQTIIYPGSLCGFNRPINARRDRLFNPSLEPEDP